ncbi:hypothetical protein AB0939_19200 [Streptomyces sp. NPDC006990]|uniref:hypothetical protein n=1 Tax=Streptomyces sp. NPDC006990 TaxID=3154481 RepID=UPI0034524A4B
MAALMGASPPGASSASASDVSDRKAPASRHTPEETRALTQAAGSGEPVELRSKRTEYTKLFANPEGDFTQDTYALPQAVQRGGALVDIDTGLKKNEDGTYSPSATETSMKFSGGGDAPLATVTRDGRSLSLTWPSGKLPTPQVHGDSVTYPEVLEGVDLTLRAHSTGFGQLLKVKNKEAAQSTELQQLDFKLSTQGLKVDADEHGNLRARNPVGQEIFTAPTPRMWDSSTDETEATPKVARSAGPTT